MVASVPGLPFYLRAFNCARAGHIENGEGLGARPGMIHHVRIDER